MIHTIIIGIAGKMGQEILQTIEKDPSFYLVGGCTQRHCPYFGKNIQTLYPQSSCKEAITDNLSHILNLNPDILIDFSLGSSLENHLKLACQKKIPFLTGTTQLSSKQKHALNEASKHIPVMHASNFSTGIAILKYISRLSAQALGEHFDVDIIESHHRHKKDAPSGTALDLLHTLSSKKNINIHSLRSGETVGKHTVVFSGPSESLEITHQVFDRKAFAKGVLKAAQFLLKQKIGQYHFDDVIRGIFSKMNQLDAHA